MPQYTKQAIPFLSSKYLNDINDASPGYGGALTAVPSGISAYQGAGLQLGDEIKIIDSEASTFSDTTVATLYGGTYKYVQMDSSASTFVLGQALFWKAGATASNENIVTNVESGSLPDFAGVLINPSVTAGNGMFIQSSGKATMKLKATLTTTVSVGSSLYMAAAGAGADNATIDCLAAATTVTTALEGKFVGIALSTNTSGGTTGGTTILVRMRDLAFEF